MRWRAAFNQAKAAPQAFLQPRGRALARLQTGSGLAPSLGQIGWPHILALELHFAARFIYATGKHSAKAFHVLARFARNQAHAQGFRHLKIVFVGLVVVAQFGQRNTDARCKNPLFKCEHGKMVKQQSPPF